jgi:ketosteroid isomerase-like protein
MPDPTMTPHELDIVAVMRRYLHGVDSRDLAAVASCFTLDAHAVFNDTTDARFELHGRGEIARRLIQIVSNFSTSCHGIANYAVQLRGTSEAELDTFVTAHILSGATVSSRGLRYRDSLVRQDDEWRIARRVHCPLWQFDNPAVASAIPGLSQVDLKRGVP